MVERVDRRMTALEHADKCGTRDQPDRSRQYPLNTEKQIIEAVNLALTKVRQVEQAKDKELAALKKELIGRIESRIWHRIVVVVAVAEFSLIVMLLEKFAR